MLYPIETIRHSTAHLLAAAIMELWPQTKLGVGPVIEYGFYYDFDCPTRLTEQQFQKIEKQMRAIIKRGEQFTREEMPIDKAILFFEERKQPYKVELLRDLQVKGTTAVRPEEMQEFNTEKPTHTSVYWTGKKFVDLCRGPHVADTRALGIFKLMRVAGAYWRGSEKNPQLQRVYGIAFATQKELDAHLAMLVEAEKRDHRKLGQELELFTFDDLVGKGLPLWLPNGTLLKDLIEDLAKREETKDGYVRVSTPHLAKEELFKISGHLPYYKDSMYPGMVMDDGPYYLKAMNCPHHHIIYKSKPKSYRDLPLRLAEYGTVYRNELSGTLAGLLRVRMLSMNDAHIYCRQDQIEVEFMKVIQLILRYFTLFNLNDYWFRLSKWDPKYTDKYINEPEHWEYAEDVLRSVLKKCKVQFVEAENEAAFYGPKVDVMFRSVIGREETMSTVQLDFAAKKRFDLSFTNEKGEKDNGVFVIHRAPLSTHERFMAFLIEHYAGAFPTWLAPVQVAIIPVAEDHGIAAEKLGATLRNEGIRVTVDGARDTVGYKIRKAEKQKVPYMIVVGDKEKTLTKLPIRMRGAKEVQMMAKSTFIKHLQKEITEKMT